MSTKITTLDTNADNIVKKSSEIPEKAAILATVNAAGPEATCDKVHPIQQPGLRYGSGILIIMS